MSGLGEALIEAKKVKDASYWLTKAREYLRKEDWDFSLVHKKGFGQVMKDEGPKVNKAWGRVFDYLDWADREIRNRQYDKAFQSVRTARELLLVKGINYRRLASQGKLDRITFDRFDQFLLNVEKALKGMS